MRSVRPPIFSKRSGFETEPNPLSLLLSEKRSAGESFVDLTESNPTRCRFRFLSTDLLKPLSEVRNLHYEPDPRGSLSARQAVCRYYAEKNVRILPEQVFLTSGTSEAYGFLFRLLADRGGAVACAEPSYPLFDTLSRLNDVALQKYALYYDRGWRTDLPSLERAVTPETRAVLVVHPNNPTGNYVSPEEKKELNAFCRRTPCALIADEVFLDFAWEETVKPSSFASNDESLTFTLGGVSKMLGLPQMKLSWIVVSGPEELRLEAAQRLEVIADAHLSVNTPAQTALPAWLSLRETVQKEILARLRINRMFLQRQVGKTGAGEVLQAEGGWYALLRFEGDAKDEETALRLLRDHQVLTHPGFLFDFNQEDLLVLSLIVEDAPFREGVDRLCEGLRQIVRK